MKKREAEFYGLWGRDEVLLTALPDEKQYSPPTSDAPDLADLLSRNTDSDVYLNVNPRRTGLPETVRGGDDDVDGLAAIVVDMDVAGPTHKDTALPQSKDDAMAFLDSLPIKPSAYVDSGDGIQGYCIFKPVIDLTDPDVRKRVKGILEGFSRMVKGEAEKRGWKHNNVFRLSHMFRAPGSFNHKLDPPVPCKVILINGNRYTLDDFDPFYVEPQATPKEQIEALLAKPDLGSDELLSEKVLKLAADASAHEPALYAKLKQRVKAAGVGLRDFDKAVRAAATPAAPAAAPASSGSALSLNGLDLHGAVAPPGYIVTSSDGIVAAVVTKNGISQKCLCSQPVVVTARLENIDTNKEMLDITFQRNGKWKTVRAPRSSLLNKTTLVKYADSGLMVTSDNAGDMVRYFADYEAENTKVIPFTRSVGRIGWIDQEFYPYAINGEIEFDGEDGEGILSALTEKGDYAEWKKAAAGLRELPFARAILAASLASPILYPLQNRIIALHVWCTSRSGKTATLKFALSIWGDPMKLMANFNSTVVGMERRAGMLKHLPLGLDELQVLNTRALSPSTIVYSLGNGYGKTRGAKNGGLQEVPKWHNCIISTGEQPIIAENDMDGMGSRVLELYGQPIEDADLGRSIHQISEDNYGFAGKKYLQFLIEQVLPEDGKLQKDFTDLCKKLSDRYGKLGIGDPGPHLDNIAALALADYYSSISLFGLSHDQAREEAVQLGMVLLQNRNAMKKEDVVDSAWHFVEGWVAGEKAHFNGAYFNGAYNNGIYIPRYGIIKPDGVYVIASVLRKTLEEAGYNYAKSIHGFRDRDYIKTFSSADGDNNVQCQMRIRGINTRVVCLKIETAWNGQNDQDEDDLL